MPGSSDLKIFVSHSHHDNEYARAFVQALRGAGADVWYDESNLQGGDQWINSIQRELLSRPVFIVLLSRNSVNAEWVREETNFALSRSIQDKSRIILPIIIDSNLSSNDIDSLSPLLALRQMIRGATFEETSRSVITALNLSQSERQPDASVGIKENTQQLVDSGNAAQAQKHYQQAVEYYHLVLETEPNNTAALNGLADTYLKAGQYLNSLDYYQKFLALEPNNSFAWFSIARLQVLLGYFDEAITSYDKAIQIEDGEVKASTNENFLIRLSKLELYVTICYYKGIALRLMGKYDEALQIYNQALSISPQMHLRINKYLRRVIE